MLFKEINSFTGEYRFLSNFWYSIVELDGIKYPTVEHAYQAAKTLNQDDRALMCDAPTAAAAKVLGRSNFFKIREDWDDVKLSVMEHLLRQKFAIPTLRDQLMATTDTELIEGNTWGDTFWGVCKGVGENHLGKLLMTIRSDINKNILRGN